MTAHRDTIRPFYLSPSSSRRLPTSRDYILTRVVKHFNQNCLILLVSSTGCCNNVTSIKQLCILSLFKKVSLELDLSTVIDKISDKGGAGNQKVTRTPISNHISVRGRISMNGKPEQTAVTEK